MTRHPPIPPLSPHPPLSQSPPPGGPRPPQLLSDAPGMHRFVWDLHYPPPPALRHEYPIAAIYRNTPREPRGPWVVPGRYTARLTVAGQAYVQPLTVTIDRKSVV